MVDTVECEVCGARVKAENEGTHMGKVHPQAPYEHRRDGRDRADRPNFYVTARTKKIAFAVVMVVVFSLAAGMLLRSLGSSTPIDPTAQAVRVSMSGFDPPSITVKAGTPLKINLINMDNQYHTDGGGWHNFAMDDFTMNVTVEPSGQKVFTVPTGTPGTYGWYCSMCCGGRLSPSMNGRVVVEP
ncbi:MAG TPA: cupredoxin domain-containing protein [Thermoplasmata archaeon]|nr:cupredoxin domain-containing protein [Thermoplasmata archaeon]